MLSQQENYEARISPDNVRAKQEALRLLKDFGYDAPPISIYNICNGLGIKVVFGDFSKIPNISGFYHAENNEIYVNNSEPKNRQTFTIAHELGHKILHEEWLNSPDYKVLYRQANYRDEAGNDIEEEANTFAANILVPKFMLEKYHKQFTLDELSTLFMVSRPVIVRRKQDERIR